MAFFIWLAAWTIGSWIVVLVVIPAAYNWLTAPRPTLFGTGEHWGG